jgi:elongation factor 2
MSGKNSSDKMKLAMEDVKNVRNIVLMGPMGSGKTCALDNLGALCGLVADDKIGETLFAHTRKDEQEKRCTIKSGLNSMAIDDLLIHALDTPGHSEYFPELAVMAPLADGALFVVDASKGELGPAVGMQLKLSDDFLHTPVLFCNKMDSNFITTKKPIDEMYDDVSNIITNFNEMLAGKANLKDMCVRPDKGQVLFGSLANGWAFSVPFFGAFYTKKKGEADSDAMSTKLWTKYFNPKKKTWAASPGDDDYVHGFVQMILSPIQKIFDLCEGGSDADKEQLKKMMSAMAVTFSDKHFEHTGNALFHTLMRLWMPAGPLIVKALKEHVPDPAAAQATRFARLVDAPPGDATSEAVKKCDPKGRLIFAITKMVPQPSASGRFYALGRVYSGKASADKCFLMDEGYVPKRAQEEMDAEVTEAVAVNGSAEGADSAAEPEEAGSESPGTKSPAPVPTKECKALSQALRIQGVVVATAKTFAAMASVPAGNICCLQGIDQNLVKRASVCAVDTDFAMRKPTIEQSPVIRVAVTPKNASELPKMVEALKRLAKSCPIVETSMEDNGKHVLAACGQEHMRVLKNDLEKEYCPVEVKWENPSITYRETVTMESSQMCLSKSPNKHNRLFIKAEPLDEEVCRAIETNVVNPLQDPKKRSKILVDQYGWDKTDSLKLWGFGPAPEEAGGSYGANVLVDQTRAIQYLNEIKESVNSGLLWAGRQGPLCEENMRGIRFNLHDVKLHADSIHRGMGQIQPTARRVFFASSMMAGIRFQEPVFNVTISAPEEVQPGIMQALGACRGEFQQYENGIYTAFVPIAETIGSSPFATVLTQKTNGKAVANYAFDHWEQVPSDPLDFKKDKMGVYQPNTKAAEILIAVRKRKGLKESPPDLLEYLDKL